MTALRKSRAVIYILLKVNPREALDIKSFRKKKKKSPMIELKWLSTATIIKGESMDEISLTQGKHLLGL